MDEDGQINEAHSISAGLDYPGIGPEHAWLNDIKRVQYLSATDDEALAAFQLCSRLEGIIPALEPAHALARVIDLAPQKPRDHLMVVNLSRPRRQGPRQRGGLSGAAGRHGRLAAMISRQKVIRLDPDRRVGGLISPTS